MKINATKNDILDIIKKEGIINKLIIRIMTFPDEKYHYHRLSVIRPISDIEYEITQSVYCHLAYCPTCGEFGHVCHDDGKLLSVDQCMDIIEKNLDLDGCIRFQTDKNKFEFYKDYYFIE